MVIFNDITYLEIPALPGKSPNKVSAIKFGFINQTKRQIGPGALKISSDIKTNT